MIIYTLPEDVLTKKAKKVTDFGDELQDLIGKMLSMMRLSMGVGLAAPQVGESLQLFVAEIFNEELGFIEKQIIVNPKLEWRSFEMEYGQEGCLSIPHFEREVERSTAIGISGQDRYGKRIEMELNGFSARVFQHEIDHLRGILIGK